MKVPCACTLSRQPPETKLRAIWPERAWPIVPENEASAQGLGAGGIPRPSARYEGPWAMTWRQALVLDAARAFGIMYAVWMMDAWEDLRRVT